MALLTALRPGNRWPRFEAADMFRTCAGLELHHRTLNLTITACLPVKRAKQRGTKRSAGGCAKWASTLCASLEAICRPRPLRINIPLTKWSQLMMLRRRLMYSLHAQLFGVVAHLSVHTKVSIRVLPSHPESGGHREVGTHMVSPIQRHCMYYALVYCLENIYNGWCYCRV